jgi:hypothetical protein
MKSYRGIWLIMAGVLAWGVFHAIGAYWNYSANTNPWRFVIVLGCVVAFLGFWGIMLAARNARLRKQNQRRLGPGDAC